MAAKKVLMITKGMCYYHNQPLAVCDKTAGALAALNRADIFISGSTWFYDGRRMLLMMNKNLLVPFLPTGFLFYYLEPMLYPFVKILARLAIRFYCRDIAINKKKF